MLMTVITNTLLLINHPPDAPGIQAPWESEVLKLLGTHGHPNLTQLITAGHLLLPGSCMDGAAVVVTQLKGEPVVAPGGAGWQPLPVAEVEDLLLDGLDGVAHLQVGAIVHWAGMRG